MKFFLCFHYDEYMHVDINTLSYFSNENNKIVHHAEKSFITAYFNITFYANLQYGNSVRMSFIF